MPRTPIVTGRGALDSISRDDKIALLREHGGILFRGFDVDAASFVALARELGQNFYNMALDPRIRELVTPDGMVAGALKGTSALPLHMERGYSPLKPELVLFHVVEPSPSGGESLVCHGTRVLETLPPETAQVLRTKRLKYCHAWEPEAWHGRYGTTPDEVSSLFAREPAVVQHRFEGEILHYDYVVSAIVRSRLGGGEAFANNLEGMWELMHAPRETRRAVHDHAIMFEDDEPIPQALVDDVHASVTRATEVHPLAAHDVLVLDNYRVMHGRRAFEGKRVIHTIMADASF